MKPCCSNALLALVLAAAPTAAQAVQAEIKVWAEVDPTLALLKPDGQPLSTDAYMPYNPATGLSDWSEDVRIFTNDTGKDVQVRLTRAVELRPLVAASGATPVPLTVSLNGRALSPVLQDFAASELFDGALPGASIRMPLVIAQTYKVPIQAAGYYEGMVSIVMSHRTASP